MSFGGGAGITAEQKFKTMKVERITTDEGDARTIVFGKVRGIVGQLIWAGKIRQEWKYAGDVEVGKDSEETYKQVPFRHYAIGICEAEGNIELSKIWRNNKLVYDASRAGWAQNARFMQKTTFYNGAYTQLPNATMESALGAGNVPAFRGTAYMIRRNINLEAFQGAVPQYVFEVDATYIPPAPSGSADLKMTVEAVPDEVIVGDTITVTYTVDNLGIDDSESAVVNFTSDPALSIVSSTLSKGSLAGGVWTIGDIANGSSETAEIAYEAIGDGIITVGATVSAATPDPDLLNNYDFHTVEIALGYDPDAQALFDRMIPEPAAPLKERINTLIVGLKTASLFYRFDALLVPASAQNAQSGLLDWRANRSAVPSGSAYWDNLGMGATGEIGSFSLAFNPSTQGVAYKLNDASITAICTRISGTSGSPSIAVAANAAYTIRARLGMNTSARPSAAINCGTATSTAGQPGITTDTILTANRSSSTTQQLFRDGSLARSGEGASTQIPDANFSLCNTSGSGGNNASWGLFAIGGAITPAEQATLKSLYDAYVAGA